MNGYEKRTQKKKEEIRAAAQSLFSRKGVAGTSITDIATAAGVSRVTLFKYFGDKESLAREVLTGWMNDLFSSYDAILASDIPVREKLVRFWDSRQTHREQLGSIVISETAWEDPDLQRLIGELAAPQARKAVTRLIREGKQQGVIDPDLDDAAILAYLGAFSNMVRNPMYIRKGPEFQGSLYRLVLEGLIQEREQ